MNLKVITSTTRAGAKGISIANWVMSMIIQEKDVDAELLDLAKINLPFMDEPNHPRLQQYQHEHTKAWSTTINSADAFIIVLGEYNYGFPAPIKNALDFLHKEWMYKPVAIVSYGGVSGGIRSTQMLKQVITTLHMVPLTDAIVIPFYMKFIDTDEQFVGDETLIKSAKFMLTELHKWSHALRALRPTNT